MAAYTLKKYDPSYYDSWNQFVSETKNGTFLFHRDFMEYHSDRFEEYSILVFEGEKIIALLPAHSIDNTVFSHQGLTYGGLIYKEVKLAKVVEIFKQILFFLSANGMTRLQIKSIPGIYHTKPAEELGYALFLADAKLLRRDSLAVIDLREDVVVSKGRLEGVSKGIKQHLKVVEEDVFDAFWNTILIPNLARKHGATPVHTLEEIRFLHSKFPKNIRQFNVYLGDKIVGGATFFESENVAHAQYISANEDKNELGTLDFLFNYLINDVFKNKKLFDFGISNEQSGKKLNEGLAFWKESFGASAVLQDFYDVKTSNFNLLDDFLL